MRRVAPKFKILALICMAAALPAQAAELPREFEGAWKAATAESFLHIRGDQVFAFEQGQLKVYGIVRHQPGEVRLRHQGKLEIWNASLDGRSLRFGKPSEVRTYNRLADIPPEVTVRPFPLGDPVPLPEERIQGIQEEILRRSERDQAVRKDPAQKALAPRVNADNKKYFLDLIREIGWLDTARFGPRTSALAAVFVKHFGDLSVNLAVLPLVERDLKATGGGQLYAILFDDTQLHLGKKQRYGTQIGEDAGGNPYVLPLEEPARVDELLKEIEQPPLATYLADVSRFLYDGKAVRLATREEGE
jgi:hypothetical protein